MAFDPKRHIMKLKGKDYLPIAARLIWFRDEHPDWGIVTTPIEINMEKQYAIFSASIFNGEGKLMATATKMENVQGFGDFIEKAETGSVGRALAYVGYGTQFAPELEEGGRFADAPYGGGGGGNFNTANRFAGSTNNGPARNNGGNGNNYAGNGNGNNGGGSYNNNAPRPNNANGNGSGAPPPPQQAARPAAPPAPVAHDDEFDEPEMEAQAAPAAAPRPAAPRPTPAPPANNGGVMRVREPEQDFADPGGDEDETDEDPFADEDDVPVAPVAAKANAPRAATATAQAAPLGLDDDEAEDDAPIAPPPTSNKCSADGCGALLPPAMVVMSTAKYGRPLCPVHQKGATALIGGNVSVGTGGAAAKPRAKAGAASSGGGNGDNLL